MSTSPWWSENGGYFDEGYLNDTLYKHDCELVSLQVDFIERILHPGKHVEIIDVACGPGRTCLELARRGYQKVTGVDINSFFLKKARAHAKKSNLNVKFVQEDMRELAFREYFDIVLSVGSSIGYFDSDDENEAVIKNMVTALKPGGTLLIEIWKHLDTSSKNPQNWEEELEDGSQCSFKTCYNPTTKRKYLTIDHTSQKDDPPRRVEVSYRAYTPKELKDILEHFGLVVEIFYLGYWEWTETPINEDHTRRVVIVAKKP